ncbi:hypothetical protein TNCT_261321 [Trichonephila clavata]|uniref:Endonuclease/exonuclease/phosphatase domain-containing protein n=1 Tax=Trichonephila clavata TaxID=2740835 RepID=A0A8X6GB05_TRICU|nr:hypothetical protein TNCT_261321 [Trichonephila clavata]
MEIDKSSTKRPATGNVQEAAKILKPSIRIESGGIQTTKEVEDVMLLGKKDLTWSVLGNPLGSDHFPVVIFYATPIACATLRQLRWKFDQTDWETFRTQADITEDMISSGLIDEAVSLVKSCILSAANNAISQPSSRLLRFPKPWNKECQMAKRIKQGLESVSTLPYSRHHDCF